MRFRSGQFVTAALAVMTAASLAGCQGSGLPMPVNGPNPQGFSTNNALVRFVDGSPDAGPAGCTAGTASCSVDVVMDGSFIGTFNPSNNPSLSTISGYLSFPSGQVLVQIFQHGTPNPVFEGAFAVKGATKYSIVLAGNGPINPPPPPAPQFFPVLQFSDGTFLTGVGGSQINFHMASDNAASVQFEVRCAACAAPQLFGKLVAFPSNNLTGVTVGPANLTPSGNYQLQAVSQGGGGTTKTVTPSQIDGLDTGNVLPDPYVPTKPNVSVYAVDTTGSGAAAFQLIGTIDNNG